MLEKKVRAFLQRRDIEMNNKRVLIGVSGGPDSLALLNYFSGIKSLFNLHIVAAHVDHMFRGEESLEDAKYVQQFCEERNIPFEMEQIDVPSFIKKTGKSSQTAARECRYDFYKRIMKLHNIDYLALGHHGDDQIETILMRLTRGSTGKARAGIPFLRPFGNGQIFRPFLCLNRMEIEDYCSKNGLTPRRDPSNEKDIYSRNRFRKKVIPFLKNENPQVHEHFQRFSEELQSDEQLLQELTVQKMNTVMEKTTSEEITMNIEAFQIMPMPLQRRGIQLILNYLYKERPATLSALHIDKVFSLIDSPNPSGKLDFPNGLIIVRSYRKCHFLFPLEPVQSYRFEIYEPGKIDLPNGDCFTMEHTDSVEEDMNQNTLLLACEDISFPLVIRTRKDGDRMSLKGMQGTRKIKDIFIDKKVPVQERKKWPIVTDANGQILWVPCLKKFNYSLPYRSYTSYILLKYIKQ